jgi:hypothetical protein
LGGNEVSLDGEAARRERESLEGGEWEWGEEDSCATAHSEEERVRSGEE